MKRMQNQAKSVSKRTWREKMTYMKKNWHLYNYSSNFPHFIGFPAYPLVK